MPLTLADLPTNIHTAGERIRWARKRKGWNQYRLADAMRVNQKTVSNWENNKHVPTEPEKLHELAEILGVPSPAWLWFGVKEIDKLDSDVIEAALKLQNLPKSKRTHHIALILQSD